MIKQLGIEQLKPSEERRRRGYPAVRGQTLDNIKRFGVTDPVPVRALDPPYYEMVSGEETWLAAQQLGIQSIPVFINEQLTAGDVAALISTREATDPINEAESFARALSANPPTRPPHGSITRLADTIGRDRSYVAHALRLLTLPNQVQSALRSGKLRAGHGKALLAVSTTDDQCRLAAAAIRGQWTVDRLRREGQAGVRESPAVKSMATQQLEQKLTDLVGSPITIDEDNGTLTIDYRQSMDVLDGILERLGYRADTV